MEAALHINLGDTRLEFYPEQAPEVVSNLVGLATGQKAWTDSRTGAGSRAPLYDNITFHRVIPGFIIQGDDSLGDGTGGPGYVFDDEINAPPTFAAPYVLATADAGHRLGKGTNGSQLFITAAPTEQLQGKYTILGAVTDRASRAVVDAISAVEADLCDRLVQDVTTTPVDVTEQFPWGYGVAAQQRGVTHHTATEAPESGVIRLCDIAGTRASAALSYPTHPSQPAQAPIICIGVSDDLDELVSAIDTAGVPATPGHGGLRALPAL